MANSNNIPKSRKLKTPPKPRLNFPLFAHQTGRWAKKYGKTKFRFYGRWAHVKNGVMVPVDDIAASAAAAEREFDRCWKYHSQGEEAPAVGSEVNDDRFTIADLANAFLNSKRQKMLRTRGLSAHTFSEYHRICGVIVDQFGKEREVDSLRPDDFAALRIRFEKGCNNVTVKSKINRARIIFKFAFDNDHIHRPVRYGQEFNRPSAKELREDRNSAGLRLFSRDELLMIFAALEGKPVAVPGEDEPVTWPPSAAMRAMVLLGLNAGFGNTDCATLPKFAVDLETGWLEFPRPKTAIRRRVPLWPETIAAINEAIDKRPAPTDPDDDELCFLTSQGTRFVRVQQSKTDENLHVTINSLSRRFELLMSALKIGQKRGIGFYTLRHVFETIAGGSKDQIAVDAIMGHSDSSMAAAYRENIEDERLRAVVNYVRVWLFGPDAKSVIRSQRAL